MLQAKQSKVLSPKDKAKIAAEILRVRNDLPYFLEEYVWTLDEDADTKNGEDPIKRFPSRADRPELYELAELWLNKEGDPDQNRLVIDKSRQMMGTWVFVACDLWDTCFHKGVRTFFQSKKEKDAKNILERAWFIYQKLPKFLQIQHQKLDTELIFPTLNSLIWAIPQGGDHIRSYTASNIFSDEAAKQPEFAEAMTASIPSIGKHGRLHALSTARGKANAFYRFRKMPAVIKKIEGFPLLKPNLNARNMVTAFLDYRMNPKYDEEWIKRTRASMEEANWNREYEGSYEEAVGTPVLKVNPLIHFRPLTHISGKPLLRGWDFGYRRPAVIVTQMNQKDQWCWLWGEIGEDETTRDFAARVFDMCDAQFPQAKDVNGRPLKHLWLDFCDPQGTEVSRGTGTSDIQDLCAVHEEHYRKMMDMNYRKRDFEIGITLIREKLKLRNDGEPGMLVSDEFEDCKDALTGGYCFPDDRKSGAKNEYPADDGYFIHQMDAARYIANCRFEPAESRVRTDMVPWPKPWENMDGAEIARQGAYA
jgi:hypothetical protein